MATGKGKSAGKQPQADAAKQVKILKDILAKHARAHQKALEDLHLAIQKAQTEQNTVLYGQACPGTPTKKG